MMGVWESGIQGFGDLGAENPRHPWNRGLGESTSRIPVFPDSTDSTDSTDCRF
jgi:hypothetical protein